MDRKLAMKLIREFKRSGSKRTLEFPKEKPEEDSEDVEYHELTLRNSVCKRDNTLLEELSMIADK